MPLPLSPINAKPPLMAKILHALDRIENAMAGMATLLPVAITVAVCLEVFMRYVINQPLVWVVELSEYALLYICFLGTAWALHNDNHVKVDIVLNILPHRVRRACGVISSLLGIAISAILLIWGTLATWEKFQSGAYNPTVVEFPAWIVLLCIPLGSFFLGIRFLRNLVGYADGTHEDRPSYLSDME